MAVKQVSSPIIDILLIFAKQIRVILIVPSLFIIFSVIYAIYFTTPIYESVSKINSSSGNISKVSQAAGIAAQFGISFPSANSESQWVYEDIIKSRKIIKNLLVKKFTTQQYVKDISLLSILTHGNEDPSFGADTLKIMAEDALIKMISVQKDNLTGVHTIKIESKEPRLAQEINFSLIDELDNYQKDYNRLKTNQTRKFIDERIVATEQELSKAEEELKNFQDRNRRRENSPSLQLTQQRLNREVSVLTGVFTTLKQQLETVKIEEFKTSSYVIVIDPPNLPLKRKSPNKRKIVISAFLMGIMLAFILALLINKIKQKEVLKNLKRIQSTFLDSL